MSLTIKHVPSSFGFMPYVRVYNYTKRLSITTTHADIFYTLYAPDLTHMGSVRYNKPTGTWTRTKPGKRHHFRLTPHEAAQLIGRYTTQRGN